jgi:uncharacterized membrane protein (UPF0127 family)
LWWPRPKPGAIKIGRTQIKTEVVTNSWDKAKGLSGRDKLAEDAGMLFVYSQAAKYPFWMNRMRFNLDFIFINQDRVVDIRENLPAPKAGEQPATVVPAAAADKILEVNAGFAAKHKIKIGDRVEYY